jgi:hypothetical protein
MIQISGFIDELVCGSMSKEEKARLEREAKEQDEEIIDLLETYDMYDVY